MQIDKRGVGVATLLVALASTLSTIARAQDRVKGAPVAIAGASNHIPLSDTEQANRRAVVRRALSGSVLTLDRKVANRTAVITTRDMANAALAHRFDGNAPAAEALLTREMGLQEMDHAAPNYGALPWQTGPAVVHDENSIEFGTQAWGPILKLYDDRLSLPVKTQLIAHARAAIAALRRHNVKVSYTSIYLMKAVNLILLGETAGDSHAAETGYTQFDDWLDYTRTHGIHEFGSPTYYSTSLDSLLAGYRLAQRPEARPKFQAALDLFWADIAAHYFAGRQDLAGPHSRDYDFLQGEGGVDLSLYTEGLKDYRRLTNVDLEKVYIALNLEPGGYHPSATLLTVAAQPVREVSERWDDGDSAIRTTYLTPEFALGSTSGSYGPQDKPVNLEIASPAELLPEISVVADDTDRPYGKESMRDKSGHFKVEHLPLNPVAVQQKGALLLLTDISGRRAAVGATSLATNVILPAHADTITVNGAAIFPSGTSRTPFTHPIVAGDVVGLRVGNVGVAVRIVNADGLGNRPPVLTLQGDPDGLRYGALRLTAYHAQGAPLPAGAARAEILFLVDHCASDFEFIALQRKAADAVVNDAGSDRDIWRSSVALDGLTLAAAYDLHTRKAVDRTIDGKPIPAPALLTVNGIEIGAPLLPASAPPPAP